MRSQLEGSRFSFIEGKRVPGIALVVNRRRFWNKYGKRHRASPPSFGPTLTNFKWPVFASLEVQWDMIISRAITNTPVPCCGSDMHMQVCYDKTSSSAQASTVTPLGVRARSNLACAMILSHIYWHVTAERSNVDHSDPKCSNARDYTRQSLLLVESSDADTVLRPIQAYVSNSRTG